MLMLMLDVVITSTDGCTCVFQASLTNFASFSAFGDSQYKWYDISCVPHLYDFIHIPFDEYDSMTRLACVACVAYMCMCVDRFMDRLEENPPRKASEEEKRLWHAQPQSKFNHIYLVHVLLSISY